MGRIEVAKSLLSAITVLKTDNLAQFTECQMGALLLMVEDIRELLIKIDTTVDQLHSNKKK